MLYTNIASIGATYNILLHNNYVNSSGVVILLQNSYTNSPLTLLIMTNINNNMLVPVNVLCLAV